MALLSLVSMASAIAQQASPPAPAEATSAGPATGAVVPQTLREVKVESEADKTSFGPNAESISRLPADLRDIPQSVTIINQALHAVAGRRPRWPSALRNVPGLTIGGAEGGQIGTNINLNGFSARTDIYLDGARDRGQYYRDVFALDSVEVLMGPSSMLFGRGSTGGVINQVSKRPTLTPANEADRLGHHQRPGAHHRRRQPAAVGDLGLPHFGDGAGRRCRPRATRPDLQDYRHRAVAEVRHRHADASHLHRAAAAQPRPCPTTASCRSTAGRPRSIATTPTASTTTARSPTSAPSAR